eukprot:SM000052S17699  [mRNA]  locus=s52:111466:114420:- [translate_table: standard]
MAGPPPPLVLEELADAALAGLDLCNHQLRVLFECLHRHDIEPFCQEEIIRFRRCSQQRYRQNLGHLNRQDKELRERLLGAEQAYSVKLSSENRRQRREELEALISLLDRRLILATGVEGMAGFKQRWQLNGQLHDARSRLQVLKDVDKAPIATTATAAPYTGEKPRRQHWWVGLEHPVVHGLKGLNQRGRAGAGAVAARCKLISKFPLVVVHQRLVHNDKQPFACSQRLKDAARSCQGPQGRLSHSQMKHADGSNGGSGKLADGEPLVRSASIMMLLWQCEPGVLQPQGRMCQSQSAA